MSAVLDIPYTLPPLRKYQEDADKSIWGLHGESLICQLPTGAGKGLLISKLLIDCVTRGQAVLVLVPTIELLDNIYKRIVKYCPFLAPLIGKLGTGRGKNINFPIVIGVYKSVASRLKKLGRLPFFHVVISDECHHAVSSLWRLVIDYFSRSWHLGFTATPARLDGKPLGDLYKHLIVSEPVSWFIQNSFLAEFTLKTKPSPFTGSDVFGDDLKNQQQYFNRSSIIGDLIEEWKEHALGIKTAWFCAGRDHAIQVTDDFNEHFNERYRFAYLGSDMTANERGGVMDAYENDKLTGIMNIGILTEGVDIDGLGCVSTPRYTSSLPLWLQMVGRALRPKADESKAVLLDHAGNALTHGAPDFDHDWSLEQEETVTSSSKCCCPGCNLPVISYQRLIKYGTAGIDILCANCGLEHHYQHTPEERAPRQGIKQEEGELVDYTMAKEDIKILKILNSNKLHHRKVQDIVKLECDLPKKIRALKQLNVATSAIEVYLGI